MISGEAEPQEAVWPQQRYPGSAGLQSYLTQAVRQDELVVDCYCFSLGQDFHQGLPFHLFPGWGKKGREVRHLLGLLHLEASPEELGMAGWTTEAGLGRASPHLALFSGLLLP